MEYEKAKQLFIKRWPFRAFPATINIDTGSEILHCRNLKEDGTCELIGKNHTPLGGMRKKIIKKDMVVEILGKEAVDFSGVTEWFLDKEDCILTAVTTA